MIEYQAITSRKRYKEAGLMHRAKKFIDDIIGVWSGSMHPLFKDYKEANPMNREVLGLIEQNQGELLAYHYIIEGLIFTAKFETGEGLSRFKQELERRNYNPINVRMQETAGVA